MTFRDEFGFFVAQFNLPYLLHSSSYEILLVGLGFFIAQFSVPYQFLIFQALRNLLMSALVMSVVGCGPTLPFEMCEGHHDGPPQFLPT